MWHEHQQVLKSTIFIARTKRTSNPTSLDLSEKVHLKQQCSLIYIWNKRVDVSKQTQLPVLLNK